MSNNEKRNYGANIKDKDDTSMSKRSYSNGKSKRRKRKPRGKQFEVNVPDSSVNKADLVVGRNAINDKAWYENIKFLTDDFATYPFNAPIGLTYDMTGNVSGMNNIDPLFTGNTIPGILQLGFSPCIGQCSKPESAANIAAQQIYTITRKANSGATNYDKTDQMMYIIAVANAYMLYEELLRGYKVIRTFNYQNRYMPETLAFAIGFSPSLQKNLKDWKGLLDLFAYKLSSLCVPDEFDFIRRWKWLCENVYKDSETDRAQLYVFRPETYYVWTEGTNNEPTSLKATSLDTLTGSVQPVYQSVDDMYEIMNALLNPILGSEDAGTISGDIAKAFTNLVQIQLASDADLITPVYVPEVLNEISNTVPVNPVNSTLDITADQSNLVAGPYLVSNPQATLRSTHLSLAQDEPFYAYMYSGVQRVLNIHDEDPSPGMVMVATRLMTHMTNRNMATDGSGTADIVCGTEIVNQIRLFHHPNIGVTDNTTLPTAFVVYGADVNAASFHTMMRNIVMRQVFDWAPLQYVFNLATNTSPYGEATILGYLGDIDNYTIIDSQQINNLHQVALMSLFALKSYRP